MPYKFPDLTGGGRDLIITDKSQVSFLLTPNLPNGQGVIQHTSVSPTQPGVHYPDPTGFFAPVWGSGDEGFTVMVGFNMVSAARYDMFATWTRPGPPGGVSGWGIYIHNGSPYTDGVDMNIMNSAMSSAYMVGTTQPIVAGLRLLHCEFSTGATRTLKVWSDTVLQTWSSAVTVVGSPYIPDGSESLRILSRGDGYGNIGRPIGVVGFWKRKLTPAERTAHLQAFNAA